MRTTGTQKKKGKGYCVKGGGKKKGYATKGRMCTKDVEIITESMSIKNERGGLTDRGEGGGEKVKRLISLQKTQLVTVNQAARSHIPWGNKKGKEGGTVVGTVVEEGS